MGGTLEATDVWIQKVAGDIKRVLLWDGRVAAAAGEAAAVVVVATTETAGNKPSRSSSFSRRNRLDLEKEIVDVKRGKIHR